MSQADRRCSPTFLTALRNTERRLHELENEEYLGEGANPRQAVFEALASWMGWVMAIDEALRSPGSEYERQRDGDPVGAAVPGLRHAWNQLKHDARALDDIVLIRADYLRSYPRRHPWSYKLRISWLRELPEFDRRGQKPRKEVLEKERLSYLRYLGGRSVYLAPPDVTKFLLSHVQAPGF